mmetsp:Transcript_19330/g.39022  ORF Transcript_19330/g.39022 Transcript_19330/m.39022 type:complete len:286 (-) Transcript_19330:296-1153(-)
MITDGSCDNNYSCFELGLRGNVDGVIDSCKATNACRGLGSRTSIVAGVTTTVGFVSLSCNAEESCYEFVRDAAVTVGTISNSCNIYRGCHRLGETSVLPPILDMVRCCNHVEGQCLNFSTDAEILPNCEGTPSAAPSTSPSVEPSWEPSLEPSPSPSLQPSSSPSLEPSTIPSLQPSSEPSAAPSLQPSSASSLEPSSSPSLQPSSLPSLEPSLQPSSSPSLEPSPPPSLQLSSEPSAAPSVGMSSTPEPNSASSNIEESSGSASTTKIVVPAMSAIAVFVLGTY